MTATQIINVAYNIACLLAVLLSEVLADPSIVGAFPPKYAHMISGAALILMWVKSHKNLFINPDGTSALTSYLPPPPTKPQP